jgi:hypothetical protein
MGQQVADRVLPDVMAQPPTQQLRELGDIGAHGHESQPHLRQLSLLFQLLQLQPAHLAQDAVQLAVRARSGMAAVGRAVHRHPESIQLRLQEGQHQALVQQRAIGDQLDDSPELLHLTNHPEDVRVGQRLPEAAEKNQRQRPEGPQAIQNEPEGGLAHPPQGLVPGVANAGAALQVALGGGLDVHPGQVGDWTAQQETVRALVNTHAGPGLQTETPGQLRRQDKAPLSIDLNTILARPHQKASSYFTGERPSADRR